MAPILRTDQEILALLGDWRTAGSKIVMTSGVFDIVHRGHLSVLAQARAFGDRLLVVINTDESVRRKKGPKRPINSLEDRMALLAALKCVDAVGSFDEEGDQPLQLVQRVAPDVFVKSSGEWTEKNFAFKQLVEAAGGEAKLVSHTANYSTSNLIKKILERYGPEAPR